MPAPLASAMSTGSSLGRYFSVVSVVPSTLFLLYMSAIIAAGAWHGPFDLSHTGSAAEVGWSGLGSLLAGSFLLSASLHPFTFRITQILEGYWGAGPLGLALARHQVARHRRNFFRLHKMTVDAEKQLALMRRPGRNLDEIPDSRELAKALAHVNWANADPALVHYLRREASITALGQYPRSARRIMPTRLGNTLRKHEDDAGRQYGLDTITIAPHMSLVADRGHYASVADEREVLDLSINLWALSVIATVLTAILLADDGAWSFLALAPFTVAYLSYHGAVAAAGAYTTAMRTVIDLSRFRLYEALHLTLPKSAAQERRLASLAMQMLQGIKISRLRFEPPIATSDPATQSLVPSREDPATQATGE